MTCKFCDSLTSWKRADSMPIEGALHPELGKHCTEYTVALVRHSWFQKRGKRSAGRTVDYRYRGLGFKLKYCPECGKWLKGGRLI